MDDLESELQEMENRAAAVLKQADAIHARVSQWLASSFQSAFYDDVHPPLAFKLVCQKEMGRREADKIWKSAEVHGIQSPELWAQYQGLATTGRVFLANGVIVNPQFHSDRDRSLPCCVLVSEDQTPSEVAACGLLADMTAMLYAGEGVTARYPKLTALVRDDEFRLFRRDQVPPAETNGRPVLLIAVHLRCAWMPPPEFPFIPLLMQPGKKGAVLQIPWHLVTGGPPPLAPAKPGMWSDFAELDREVDRVLAQQGAQKPGVFRWFYMWFSRAVWAVVLFGLIGGLFSVIKDKVTGEKKPAPPQVTPVVVPSINPWNQSQSLRSLFAVVSPSQYEPLDRPDGGGKGFILRDEGSGLLVGLASRQTRRPSWRRPDELTGRGGLIISLASDWTWDLPGLHFQAVTKTTGAASCLPHASSDVLKTGDVLRVILSGGNHVEGRLTQRKGDGPLSARSERLTLQLSAPQNLADQQGCPVVHAGTGRVVGVLQEPGEQTVPDTVEIQTIRMPKDLLR